MTMMISFVFALLLSQGSAFSPSFATSLSRTGVSGSASSASSALHLFGSPKDGEKKGPGMMDQLAMFKKAQEMAQKKQKMDEELKKMEFSGSGADGKVTGTFKYVPISNPMDPNPDYECTAFTFDQAYYDAASPEELSEAVKAAVVDGIANTNLAVAEKYAVLQEDLLEAFGQK
jgi:YbaB/EbfC DNA-binding family